jgi:hypothetical protein
MNIESVNPDMPSVVSKPRLQATESQQQSQGGVSDSLTTEQNEQLMGALRNAPDVRPEMVARGRSLAADADYPPDEVVSAVAKLFVMQ